MNQYLLFTSHPSYDNWIRYHASTIRKCNNLIISQPHIMCPITILLDIGIKCEIVPPTRMYASMLCRVIYDPARTIRKLTTIFNTAVSLAHDPVRCLQWYKSLNRQDPISYLFLILHKPDNITYPTVDNMPNIIPKMNLSDIVDQILYITKFDIVTIQHQWSFIENIPIMVSLHHDFISFTNNDHVVADVKTFSKHMICKKVNGGYICHNFDVTEKWIDETHFDDEPDFVFSPLLRTLEFRRQQLDKISDSITLQKLITIANELGTPHTQNGKIIPRDKLIMLLRAIPMWE